MTLGIFHPSTPKAGVPGTGLPANLYLLAKCRLEAGATKPWLPFRLASNRIALMKRSLKLVTLLLIGLVLVVPFTEVLEDDIVLNAAFMSLGTVLAVRVLLRLLSRGDVISVCLGSSASSSFSLVWQPASTKSLLNPSRPLALRI